MNQKSRIENSKSLVALLTGGADRPYAFGLATALMSKGVPLDLVGNDELEGPEFRGQPGVRFFNLRGDQRPGAPFSRKVFRVLRYYRRLVRYAASSRAEVFHILWNNKFEMFDRTLLMLYYRFLGKKIVLTLHNVNSRTRDGNDTHLNRLTLRIQYLLADHLFVHTQKMKLELIREFHLPQDRITVIPFGINNAVPITSLTRSEARQQLGIRENENAILFFGNITPYKGLEYLIRAFRHIHPGNRDFRLIIAGRPKNCESYWRAIQDSIREDVQSGRILLKPDFIPDDETEVYFKAADVLALPYRHIYQSGVLFLGYSFGLPVIAADVGALKDEILEGRTGFLFRPENSNDLAKAIERYFESDLYADLNNRRQEIRDYAAERHSWDVVSQMTLNVYRALACRSGAAAMA